MDRSFLSHASVIEASREFVCVRLMTYENKDEAAFLKSFGAGRSGELENTVFCLFAPDGQRQLTKGAREPGHLFDDPPGLAKRMVQIAKDYPAKDAQKELPMVNNLRLALNVAACDKQPLVVIRTVNEAARKKLADTLGTLAWTSEFIGQFVYVATTSPKELAILQGAEQDASIFVVIADTYGLKGSVVAQSDAEVSPKRLAQTFRDGLTRFARPERNFWQHVKEGQHLGVFWDTQTPVTDPLELRAREKGRKKINSPAAHVFRMRRS